MILLYTDKLLDVEIPQIVPTCEAFDGRILPLVGEDLRCLYTALRTTTRGVVVKTRGRLWIALARELRPDLVIYLWGLPLRGRGLVPIYIGPEYRGPGLYYVRNRGELERLRGYAVDGVVLDARGFDPRLVELIAKGKVRCDCEKCGLVERLACEVYKEVEVL